MKLGFKTAAARSPRWKLSGAAFHYDYDNKTVARQQGNVGSPFRHSPLRWANIPRSRIEGAELDATVRTVAEFHVCERAGPTIDSKVSGVLRPSRARLAGWRYQYYQYRRASHFRLPPKWQFDAERPNYDRPIFEVIGPGFLGVGSTYQSTSQGTFWRYPSLQLPSYSVVDLRIGGKTARIGTSELWGAQYHGPILLDPRFPLD